MEDILKDIERHRAEIEELSNISAKQITHIFRICVLEKEIERLKKILNVAGLSEEKI